MTQQSSPDEMFAGGGDYVPGFWFGQVGNAVQGEILSTEQQVQTEYKKPDVILYDKQGRPKQQLKVVLQTSLRNWDGVRTPPVDQETQQPRPASEDDGRRAVYVKGWMVGAVGDAVAKATGQRAAPKVGGKLAVRTTELIPTSQGNPYPKFEAAYQPPANVQADGMFSEQQQAQQPAPQQPAPQAQGQQGSPWQAPPAPQQQAPQQDQGDPWAGFTGSAEPKF